MPIAPSPEKVFTALVESQLDTQVDRLHSLSWNPTTNATEGLVSIDGNRLKVSIRDRVLTATSVSPHTDTDDDLWEAPDDAVEVEIPAEEETIAEWQSISPPEYSEILSAQPKDDNRGTAGAIAAAILIGVWLYDRTRATYLAPTTKSKKRSQLSLPDAEEVLAESIERGRRQYDRINRDYWQENIGLDDWFDRSESKVVNLHTAAYVLGRGGWAQMSERDRETLSKIIRYHRHKLSEFHSALIQESIGERAAFNRLRMYALSARSSFSAGVKAAMAAAGYTEGRRHLDPVPHPECEECKTYDGWGWVGIERVVPIGVACSCGGNCRCTIAWRR